MKKLIAMIGAVAMSFGLFADAFTSVNDDIQTRELGDSNIVGSGEPDDIHWWDDNFATTGYEQPAVVSNDTTLIENTKYLKVETDSSPLLRTFTPVTTGGDPATYSYGKVDIENHGLFIDTKVRMTGFESDPTPQGAENKLLVWLKAVTDEDAGGAGYTNLMVTCGFVDGEGNITPTNYVVKAAGLDVKPDEWVRLTIRADKDTTDNVAKFKVFVNEKQVTADVEGGELSVFPSLIGGANELSLAAAGFQGNGGINSVGLLTAADAPDFAADPTILTITWNEGVTGFTVGEQKIDVTGNGTTNLVIASDALTDIVVTPTFQQDPQFELKGYTLGGEEQSPEEDGSAKFSMTRYEENLTLAIEAKQSRVGATLFVDGHSLGDYAFVKEAIGALATIGEFNSAKITLAMDEAITDFGDWSELSGDITLDLNGKTVSVDTEKAWAGSQTGISGVGCLIYNNNEANITITNSISDCGQLVGSDNVWLVYNKNGTMSLANANIKYDGNIYSSYATESQFYGQLTIYGGKFKPKAEFYDESNGLAEGLVWGNEDTDGFFPVEEKTADDVAQIGDGRKFTTLAEAFDEADATDTVTLLANVTLGEEIAISDKNITLDGKFTVSTSAGKAFNVRHGATLTIAADTTVTASGEDTTIFVWPYEGENAVAGQSAKATLIVNGTVTYTGSNGMAAITTHGNDSLADSEGVEIVINGTVSNTDDAALYLPGKGVYTVNAGANITGVWAGIQMKSGTLTVNGGTISCTGADSTPTTPYNNGANKSGCAIQLEGNGSYWGNMTLTVNGGMISAQYGKAIYGYGDATKLGAITLNGGTFTCGNQDMLFQFDTDRTIIPGTSKAQFDRDVSKFCVADFKTVKLDGDDYFTVVPREYVAQVGTDKFETVAEALAKVQELEAAGTYPINVTALDDVTIPGTVVGDSLTLAEEGTIAITANSWTITGTVSGKVTLAYGKTLVVPAGSEVTVSPTSSEDYEIKKSTADDKDTYTVAEVAKEITITLVKTESIADIKTNGTSVIGAVKLPADTTSIEIELFAASTIKIPVYKVSYAEVGGNVRSKKATYTIKDGDTLTFSAEEASSGDTQVDEAAAKQAFKDLGETEAAKIEALTTGTDPIEAKAVATWINNKGLDPTTVLAGEFVKASVKLDTTAPITTETPVKIEALTKGEGTVLTFKVKVGADDVSTKAAITSMVKATDDLTKKAWELAADVAIAGETVRVTPPTGKTQAFVKVVIPADASAAE